ncbi:MAG: peptidylprolyl isomerase [Catenulispora sp.]|nr:peptidylprolyl isomerase [Catenulispora sp.]
MASSRTRARKLARAKLNRQMARRAEQQRRGRQVKAGLAVVLALAVAGLGTAWLLGAFDKKVTPTPQAQCAWTTQSTEANADLKDVGQPGTSGLPDTGTGVMSVALNTGTVQVTLDRAGSPCAAASLAYLASKNYYDNTPCFSLTHSAADGYALTCGDHTGKGTGGPTYTFYNEQVAPMASAAPSASAKASATPAATPSANPPTYAFFKAGTVVMNPSVSGSQFMIFYKDSTLDTSTHNYSVVGQVTSGLEAVDTIAKAGTVNNDAGANVKPKNAVTVQTLTVADGPSPSAAASTEPSGSTAPSTQPSASASAS